MKCGLFSKIGDLLSRLLKTMFGAIYIVVALYTTLLTGCIGVTPTRVPPLTKELGFTPAPNIKGWTTVGLNEAAYKYHGSKLEIWRTMMDLVNEPAILLHDQAVDWLNIALSASAFGGIPLAAAVAGKKIPKHAISREEHERAVADAKNG